MQNIYINNSLAYPLNHTEYENINDVWEFIKIFNKPYIFITDYRNYLLKTIRDKYTIEQFHYLESIAEKMFWNLREKIVKLFAPVITNDLVICETIQYDDNNFNDTLDAVLNNIDTYYRSFINKLIIIDNRNKTIYCKKMEGSAKIFSESKFNLYTMTVFLNRHLYESIMNIEMDSVSSIDDIEARVELSNYYYQHDYGFPNLNYCNYNIGDVNYKINRIRKLYYFDNPKYWYKLIH